MSVPNKIKQRGKILDEIMRYQRENLPKIMREVPLANLRALVALMPATTNLHTTITHPGVSLIAECKKASPSKGLIAHNYDPATLAKNYAKAGAAAISVLTDARHFQGNLIDLQLVKETITNLQSSIPILRKDFIFHPYQIYESRAAGADALLLIAAVLSQQEMSDLLALTHKLGMCALAEIHNMKELQMVLPLQPKIIGINNRNLQTFAVDFENTARLRDHIPPQIVVVGESGINTEYDVKKMAAIGIDAILVGETLMRSKNPRKLAERFVRAGRVS